MILYLSCSISGVISEKEVFVNTYSGYLVQIILHHGENWHQTEAEV